MASFFTPDVPQQDPQVAKQQKDEQASRRGPAHPRGAGGIDTGDASALAADRHPLAARLVQQWQLTARLGLNGSEHAGDHRQRCASPGAPGQPPIIIDPHIRRGPDSVFDESSPAPLVPTHHGRVPVIIDRAEPVYRALLIEIERRRVQLGWPMWKLEDVAGVNDGHYGHMLHVDRKTGRQATWKIVQLVLDAMYPRGFDLILKPKSGGMLTAEGTALKIKFAAADHDRQARRALMSALGKRGAQARAEKYKIMSKEERQRIAKKARKTRRKNCLLRAQLAKQKPKTSRSGGALQPCVAGLSLSVASSKS